MTYHRTAGDGGTRRRHTREKPPTHGNKDTVKGNTAKPRKGKRMPNPGRHY